jgi:hypothetical protein
MYLSAGHGLAVCVNLPIAFSRISPPDPWDVPPGQALTGVYEPYSWGGHSMWAIDYDEKGITLEHTWEIPEQKITWRACAAYMDEVHLVIDSANYWKKRAATELEGDSLLYNRIIDAVNQVSSHKIPT